MTLSPVGLKWNMYVLNSASEADNIWFRDIDLFNR